MRRLLFYDGFQDLVEELGKLNAEEEQDCLETANQAKIGIEARETGSLCRGLSIVMQKTRLSLAPIPRMTDYRRS